MVRSFLIVGAGLLAGLIALELRPGAEPVPAAADAASALPRPLTAIHARVTPVPMSAEALLARPLFSPDRRPPRAADAARPASAGPVPLPRMTGILINGAERRALFAGAGGRPEVVLEGGQIGAFTVRRIEPRQVTVAGPDGMRVLRTSFDPSQSPASASVPSGLVGLIAPSAPAFR